MYAHDASSRAQAVAGADDAASVGDLASGSARSHGTDAHSASQVFSEIAYQIDTVRVIGIVTASATEEHNARETDEQRR
jgi:hypothetical protein